MIDINPMSILYILISICFLILSNWIKKSEGGKSKNMQNSNVSVPKSERKRYPFHEKKDLKRGSKYLNYLLDQLSKAINETNKTNSFSSLSEIVPENLRSNLSSSVFPFFTIVYATQSNISKRFAERISQDAISLNLKCQVKNISEITIEDFNKNIFLVFFISTYGEGGPTDDCIEVNKLMEAKGGSNRKHKFKYFEDCMNDDLNYTIFGLGSSKYENFNEMAKKFDSIFKKVGFRNEIVENGVGDDAKNINLDFENWRKDFWVKTCKYFSNNKEKVQKLAEKLNLKDLYESVGEEVEITMDKDINLQKTQIDINEYDFGTKRYLNSEEFKIESITELRKENINGSTLKIIYTYDSHSENAELKYRVGDNIGVYPVNNLYNVEKVISRLNYDPDMKVQIKKSKPENSLKKKINIPEGQSVREIMSNVVDLSCQIK